MDGDASLDEDKDLLTSQGASDDGIAGGTLSATTDDDGMERWIRCSKAEMEVEEEGSPLMKP